LHKFFQKYYTLNIPTYCPLYYPLAGSDKNSKTFIKGIIDEK